MQRMTFGGPQAPVMSYSWSDVVDRLAPAVVDAAGRAITQRWGSGAQTAPAGPGYSTTAAGAAPPPAPLSPALLAGGVLVAVLLFKGGL